jgi:GNAT superfamily N-acetyltransferase
LNRVTIVDLFPMSSDETADKVVSFRNAARQELMPRLPGITVEEFRVGLSDPSQETAFFGITDGSDDIEALGVSVHFVDGPNAHLQWTQLSVRPGMRQRGHAKQLLARACSLAEVAGRTMLGADAYDSVPAGDAFALTVGASVGMREQINVVKTAAVDRAMLETWRQDGPVRADGYEVLQWVDGYPPEHDAQIARLFVGADEDMPFEDAAFDPGAETAETVRTRLERTKGTITRVTSVARHIESGDIVGFSELLVRKSDRDTLFTSLTAVDRDHRGHALGKWLKADAILRGMERWPEATFIQTENAHSNAPMLGINRAIGFEVEHTAIFYQVTVEKAREYLART